MASVTVSMEFECDNAAFEDDPGAEAARVVAEASQRIAKMLDSMQFERASGALSDVNGNVIGRWSVELDDWDYGEDEEEEDAEDEE